MFRFKQFTIQQDNTPMKVGTDGVLLGSWADIEEAKTILDIGTGTGLIALMSAQRNPLAQIDALEIEPHACQQAHENIIASPWAKRINIFPVALQNYHPKFLYDSIICNPPFFINSTKAPKKGRSIARHNDTLPHRELIENVSQLLKPQGNFCVILPVAETQALIRYAEEYQLYPAYITRVIPTPGKPTKRILIKFTFSRSNIQEDELILEFSRHHYSKEYIELTKAFYLQM